MGTINTNADPLAPYEEIYDAGEDDGILTIVPPSGSSRLYINAPDDMLDGWNKKKQSGSHTLLTTRNQRYDTGIPGTLRLLNDANSGIYLMNTDGSAKGLFLNPTSNTIDTDAHTQTVEFTLVNEGSGEDVTVIDACDSVDGWATDVGTDVVISSADGHIEASGTPFTEWIVIKKTPSVTNYTDIDFIIFELNASQDCECYFAMRDTNGKQAVWTGIDSWLSVGSDTRKYIIPVHAPLGTTRGPLMDTGVDLSIISALRIGIAGASVTPTTVYIDNITACNGQWAKIECAVPDVLQIGAVAGKYRVDCQTYNPTTPEYKACLYHNIANGTYVFRADGFYYLDGTCLRDVLAVENYAFVAAAYSVGEAGETVNRETTNAPAASPSSVTYSNASGATNRNAIAVYLPPSDNGRTDINKVQLKFVTYYDADADGNYGATTFEFEPDSFEHFMGLSHSGNWIAYERPDSRIEVYLFSRQLDTLSLTEDEDGNLCSIECGLKKGTKVARAWVRYPDFDSDSNSDEIPNFIDKIIEQLENKFAFTRQYCWEYDLTGLAITPNDFGETLETAGPVLAISEGARAYDSEGNYIEPEETISTEDGNLSLIPVYGKPTIQVFDDELYTTAPVEVFDTVTPGNTVESTWALVTRADWVFTGDCVVQNGLIRIRMDKYESAYLSPGLFVYTDSWKYVGIIYGIGSSGHYFSTMTVSSISSDSVSFTLTADNGASANCVMYRGEDHISLDFTNSPDIGYLLLREITTKKYRFYNTDSGLIDTSFATGFSAVNQFSAVGIGTSLDYIPYVTTVDANNLKLYQGATIAELGWEFGTGTPSKLAIGALPISPEYYEAEDMTASAGVTDYTGADAFPGSGVTGKILNSVGNYIQKIYTVGTNIDPGTYTIFYRTKESEDVMPGDFYMKIYDTTSASYLVYRNYYTPSTTFSIHSVGFTITSAMVGHNIQYVVQKESGTGTSAIDYILILKTSAIKTAAGRSMPDWSEVTKVYKEV